MLGFLAGRFDLFKPESGEVLANLGLTFCLPALLFNATATMTMAELHDWRFFLGLALGLLVIYFLALTISMGIFRKPVDASSLQALSSAFPSMALVGIPLLLALIGRSAVLSVAFANLVVSFVMMPVTLTLLEAGRPTEAGHTRSGVVWGCLLHVIKQPLVWAPIAGLAMAAAHIPLPEMAQRSFALIGEATSGFALFATGLLLSGQKLRINSAVALSVTLKNPAQPAVMWLIALLFGLTTLHRREMVPARCRADRGRADDASDSLQSRPGRIGGDHLSQYCPFYGDHGRLHCIDLLNRRDSKAKRRIRCTKGLHRLRSRRPQICPGSRRAGTGQNTP